MLYIAWAGYDLAECNITISGSLCSLVLWNGTGILDVGGDWVHSGFGFEAAYADAGYGTHGLDAYSFNNTTMSFTSPTNVDVDDFGLLSMRVNIKNWAGSKDVSVYFDTGNSIDLSTYVEKNNHNVWQEALIPLSDFGLSSPIELNKLTLSSNGNIGFYLDDIEFVVGSVITRVVSINAPSMGAEEYRPITQSISVTLPTFPEPSP